MQILISGNINDAEISDIQTKFGRGGISVEKLFTASADSSGYIQLLFRDFGAISFSRDFITTSNITLPVNKVINLLKDKFKRINGIRFELQFIKKSGNTIIVNFSCSSEFYMSAFNVAGKVLNSEVIDNCPDNKIMWISYEDGKLKMKESE